MFFKCLWKKITLTLYESSVLNLVLLVNAPFCSAFHHSLFLLRVCIISSLNSRFYWQWRSITNSWSSLKLMSIESVMPSSHLILCHPLLLLPSVFPSIRSGSFQMSQFTAFSKRPFISFPCITAPSCAHRHP